MNRRSFIVSLAVFAGGAAVSSVAIPFMTPSKTELLRPPGAIPEKDYLGACIKCGLCVQICPVSAPLLSDINTGMSANAAYIDPRHGACDFSCIGIQCALVCPTGALLHEKAKNAEATRIGLAVLKPDLCLRVKHELYTGPAPDNYDPNHYKWKVNPDSYRKYICRVCADKCPIGPGAITIEDVVDKKTGAKYQAPVIQHGCTGCGVCEMVCPVPEPAIVIIPWKKYNT